MGGSERNKRCNNSRKIALPATLDIHWNVAIQQTTIVIDILIVEETKEGLISARANYTNY